VARIALLTLFLASCVRGATVVLAAFCMQEFEVPPNEQLVYDAACALKDRHLLVQGRLFVFEVRATSAAQLSRNIGCACRMHEHVQECICMAHPLAKRGSKMARIAWSPFGFEVVGLFEFQAILAFKHNRVHTCAQHVHQSSLAALRRADASSLRAQQRIAFFSSLFGLVHKKTLVRVASARARVLNFVL
jgi:hypothetical protein